MGQTLFVPKMDMTHSCLSGAMQPSVHQMSKKSSLSFEIKKFVKVLVPLTYFMHFVWGKLGEFKSRYLGHSVG